MTHTDIEKLITNSKPFVLTKQLPNIHSISREDIAKILAEPKNSKYIQVENTALSATLINFINSKFKNIVLSYNNINHREILRNGFNTYNEMVQWANQLLEISNAYLDRLYIIHMRLIKKESKLSNSDIIIKNMKYSDIESKILLAHLTNSDTSELLVSLEENRTVQSVTLDILNLYGLMLDINSTL